MKAKSYFERKWLDEVSRVFDTRPRNASSHKVIWLPRDSQEKAISGLLSSTKHICIDGPTGTGKTSLALTMLGQSKIRYVSMQIVRKMTWQEFCMNLVRPTSPKRTRDYSSEFKIGVESGLPTATMQVTLGSPKHNMYDLRARAKHWSEHDVCHVMEEENKSLLIDDFEKANDELISRVADMAKLLAQTYSKNRTKLIIVGTDDIYRRILSKDPSLDARMSEVSLGAFPSENISWKYLTLGFEALNLTHPSKSKLASERSKVNSCIRAVYDAADGLPKSLTDLGWEIAAICHKRPGPTVADITTKSNRMLRNKAMQYRRKYPSLMSELRSNASVRAVFRCLLQNGVGSIHYMDEFVGHLIENIGEAQVQEAVTRLVELELITQTGMNNDVLFFRDLPFAHTLGVISQNPKDYGLGRIDFAPLDQLSLPFGFFGNVSGDS